MGTSQSIFMPRQLYFTHGAKHDNEVQAKLYEVHRGAPDAHITASNELRD